MVFTLRKRILLGYGIAIFLTATVLVWAVFNLSRLGKASDAILRENYASIDAVSSMLSALEEQNSAMLLSLSENGDLPFSRFQTNEVIFLRWLGRARDNITEAGETEIIAELDSLYSNYLEHVTTLRLLREKDLHQARVYSLSSVRPYFEKIREACFRLREINRDSMYRTSASAGRIASNAIASTLVLGIVAILLGFGFSLLLADSIVRPVRRFTTAARDIASGMYDVEFAVTTSDEIGSLAKEFSFMADKLKSYRDMNVGRLIAEKNKSDAIIKNMDDGIIFVGADHRVLDINPTAAGIFQAGPTPEGRHILEIVRSEELFERLKKIPDPDRKTALPVEGNILTIERGGAREHYEYSIVPVPVDSGTHAGMLIILRNVTRLKELDMLKSQFVMTASHELRTPLTSALMSIDLLAENASSRFSEKESELLTAAREELHRLRALINDLLELSKIESGRIDMAFESVELPGLIETAVSVLMKQSESLGINLSYLPEGDLPRVKADPTKVVWVLTNLLSNALRYTDPGGWVRVAAARFGNQVHISVADNGIGIPYEYQSRIFDKFVQVKTDRGNGGTGLGLAICREIVRAHGGAIWVDSAPGTGSVFTFTLPVSPDGEKENDA